MKIKTLTVLFLFCLASLLPSAAAVGGGSDIDGHYGDCAAAVIIDAEGNITSTAIMIVEGECLITSELRDLLLSAAMGFNPRGEIQPKPGICCVPNPPKEELYIHVHLPTSADSCKALKTKLTVCADCQRILYIGAQVDTGQHIKGAEYNCPN